MLDDELKQSISAAYQSLIVTRNLKPRLGQRQMIAAVANALGDPDAPEPIAVVEAGTGTGKTIAYTVAGIPVAKERGKHLVLATATVALQEQLIGKDLPDIKKHSGLDFSVQLAKGRGRYVCLQKLDQGLAGARAQTLIPMYPDEFDADDGDSGELIETMVAALGSGEWDGDMDAWPATLSSRERREVTSDVFQCGGRRCPHIAQCSFFRARDGLAEADVIVTNHDLVLSDLKLGGGVILPPPEDCLFVFDEGHQLPGKCLNHFMLQARASSTEQALAELSNWLQFLEQAFAETTLSTEIITQLEASCVDLTALTRDAEQRAHAWVTEQAVEQEAYRFKLGVAPKILVDSAAQLVTAWRHHHDLAVRLQASLDRLANEAAFVERDTFDTYLANANAMVGRADAQLMLWSSYAAAGAAPENPPEWARWLRLGRNDQRIEWLASPILASGLLQEHLWSRAAGVVVSSATLSAMGCFDRFVMRSGIPEKARMQRVVSPFDPSQIIFSVPNMQYDPAASEQHTKEIISLLPGLIAGNRGVLILFGSRRQMEAVAADLSSEICHQLLVQDSMSKSELLRRHRSAIDAGKQSAIFGLASFAEGIDLPGAYCEHVVIAKLPFAVPDDPLEAAHAERVEAEGGNPFMTISVPDAALKLTQACGRLQRAEEDHGRITLLDRRIIDRRYGRDILRSLPDYHYDLAAERSGL